MTNQEIHMWEFTFYSEEERDTQDVCYYTYTDNRQTAFEQFAADEGPVDFDLYHAGTISEETMIEWYGSLDMVLDR